MFKNLLKPAKTFAVFGITLCVIGLWALLRLTSLWQNSVGFFPINYVERLLMIMSAMLVAPAILLDFLSGLNFPLGVFIGIGFAWFSAWALFIAFLQRRFPLLDQLWFSVAGLLGPYALVGLFVFLGFGFYL